MLYVFVMIPLRLFTEILFRFMRPGTVHSVTTLQDSIAFGGHFFSAPTIKHSIYSVFHTFVGSHTITNVPMDNEQQMLLRIVLFWHKRMCDERSTYLEMLGEGTSISTFIWYEHQLTFIKIPSRMFRMSWSSMTSWIWWCSWTTPNWSWSWPLQDIAPLVRSLSSKRNINCLVNAGGNCAVGCSGTLYSF